MQSEPREFLNSFVAMSARSSMGGASAANSERGAVLAVLHFYDPPKDKQPPEFRVTHPSGTGVKIMAIIGR
jgi:hypothetical protein